MREEAKDPKLPTLRYCRNNVTLEARRQLRESGFPVQEDGCLDRCDACYWGAYLIVDEEIVTGDSHDDILEMLRARYAA